MPNRKKCNIELIEWVDITRHSNENVHVIEDNCGIRFIQIGMVIKEFKLHKKRFIRICPCFCINSKNESDFYDIPKSVILSRKVLDTITLTEG